MSVLVVGASGATGRMLVSQLLQMGQSVKAVVRESSSLPEALTAHENITVIRCELLSLSDAELQQMVAGCVAIASCLGHNLTFKGMYGKPRQLVTDTVTRLCQAVKANAATPPCKFILMNSSGCRNLDLNEPVSLAQRCVVGLIRALVPPHRDNEMAGNFLRIRIGQHDPHIQWVAVRPDTLIDEDHISAHEEFPSPIRSAIFDAGSTSRINVAHFFTQLLTDKSIWQQWQGQMPVIYNKP